MMYMVFKTIDRDAAILNRNTVRVTRNTGSHNSK